MCDGDDLVAKQQIAYDVRVIDRKRINAVSISPCMILSTSVGTRAGADGQFGIRKVTRSSCIMSGSCWVANIADAEPIRKRPYSAPATSAISAIAESCSRQYLSGRVSNRSPASVRITLLGVRVNIGRPTRPRADGSASKSLPVSRLRGGRRQ